MDKVESVPLMYTGLAAGHIYNMDMYMYNYKHTPTAEATARGTGGGLREVSWSHAHTCTSNDHICGVRGVRMRHGGGRPRRQICADTICTASSWPSTHGRDHRGRLRMAIAGSIGAHKCRDT